MATQTNVRLLDAKATQSIIASRAIVRATQDGDTVRFHIQGNGNLIPVTTREGAQVMAAGTDNIPLTKTIYGVKANSHIAMLNPNNQKLLREAMQAETAGEMDDASKLFNQYLNKIQVSFSVIHNPGRKTVQFYNQQLVEGEVRVITTENGSLITMENTRPVAVAKLAQTRNFELADLMGLSEDGPKAEDVFTPITGAEAENQQETEDATA